MTTRRSAAHPPGPLAAFVLHLFDWSESSVIVDLFTRERGRIVVVAKGAKKPTSNFRALLLPFHRLQVQLGRTPVDAASEIHALRTVEINGWQGGLPHSAAALFAAFYANELLLKLLSRQDPHPALFDRYAEALPRLAEDDAQAALRAFELLLLRELGWLPDLHTETASLRPVRTGQGYALDGEMGVVAVADQGIDGAALLQIEAALTHGGFAPVQQATNPVAARLRGPLRRLLHYHLPPSGLRTRQVLEGVQALQQR